jgi:hypothetical protein
VGSLSLDVENVTVCFMNVSNDSTLTTEGTSGAPPGKRHKYAKYAPPRVPSHASPFR